MAEKNGIRVAKAEIEKALRALVLNKASSKVHVFETEWGNLRAIVGADGFKDMKPGQRLEVVWNHLRNNLSEDSMKFLFGVHPMDQDEYESRTHEVRPDSEFPE